MFALLEKRSSPYINRFLSADTIVPGYANPQNLNRYSYVTNNPLRYTDPTGHMLDDGCRTEGCTYTPPSPAPAPSPSPLPSPDDDDDNNSDRGGGHPLPSPTPTSDDCPDGNVCLSDVSTETMQDYWGANNDFTNVITWGGVTIDLTTAALDYVVSQGYLTGPSLALIVSYVTVAVMDPLPLEEIVVGIGAGVIAWNLVATAGGSDIQNINNAIVETGAFYSGGSVAADWDGATITGPNGSATVDTWIPFSAPVSLLLWSIPDPEISVVP